MTENGSERIPFDASGTFSITHLVEIVFHRLGSMFASANLLYRYSSTGIFSFAF